MLTKKSNPTERCEQVDDKKMNEIADVICASLDGLTRDQALTILAFAYAKVTKEGNVHERVGSQIVFMSRVFAAYEAYRRIIEKAIREN